MDFVFILDIYFSRKKLLLINLNAERKFAVTSVKCGKDYACII